MTAPPRVACLEDIKNDPRQGGADKLISFVKENADVIRARNSFAKVCVLLDWDSAAKVAGFTSTFKTSDPFLAMAWDVKEANPNFPLTQNCKGVECFYPDSALKEVMAARSDLFFTNPQGVITVKREEIDTVKQLLNAQVNKGLTDADVQFAKPLIQRLIESLK